MFLLYVCTYMYECRCRRLHNNFLLTMYVDTTGRGIASICTSICINTNVPCSHLWILVSIVAKVVKGHQQVTSNGGEYQYVDDHHKQELPELHRDGEHHHQHMRHILSFADYHGQPQTAKWLNNLRKITLSGKRTYIYRGPLNNDSLDQPFCLM